MNRHGLAAHGTSAHRDAIDPITLEVVCEGLRAIVTARPIFTSVQGEASSG